MAQGRGYEDRRALEGINYRLRDLERRMGSVVQYGRVKEVDYEKRRAKVEFFPEDGDQPARTTGWIPWSQGTNDKGAQDWQPLQEDSQVAVLAAAGDPANGIILSAGVNYNDEENNRDYRPWVEPEDEGSEAKRKNMYGRQYADGTKDYHNQDGSSRVIEVPAGGSITFKVGSSSIVITDGEVVVTTPRFRGEKA